MIFNTLVFLFFFERSFFFENISILKRIIGFVFYAYTQLLLYVFYRCVSINFWGGGGIPNDEINKELDYLKANNCGY